MACSFRVCLYETLLRNGKRICNPASKVALYFPSRSTINADFCGTILMVLKKTITMSRMSPKINCRGLENSMLCADSHVKPLWADFSFIYGWNSKGPIVLPSPIIRTKAWVPWG